MPQSHRRNSASYQSQGFTRVEFMRHESPKKQKKVLIQVKKKARTAVYQSCKYMGSPDWSYDYGSYIGKRY